jgi:cytochrome P450
MSINVSPPLAVSVPTVPGLPLLGNIVQMRREPSRFMNEVVPQYGNVVKVQLGPESIYVVSHPEGIQRVLRDHNRNYIKGKTVYPLFAVSGAAMVNMEGGEWLERRRVMQPHFHRKHITELITLMQTAIEEQFPFLDQHADTGQYVDLSSIFRLMTAHVFTKTFYGLPLKADEAAALSKAMLTIFTYVFPRYLIFSFVPENFPFPGKKEFSTARQLLHSISKRLIDERRKLGVGGDLLSMFIQMNDDEQDKLNDKQLLEETVSLMQGGFDTSSGTLAWVFYMLMQNPHVTDKLLAEYDAVLAGQSTTTETVTKLNYTHQVIQETMRLYPSATGVTRLAVEKDQIDGCEIPANAMIYTSFFAVHRRADFWESPLEFRPERFGQEGVPSHPFAYVPFATGPRQCIGDQFALFEMRLTVAALLQRYKFTLKPDYQLETAQEATFFPKKLPVLMERRT